MTTKDYSSTFFKVQGTRTMYLLKNWLDSLSNAIVIIPLDVTDTPNHDEQEPTATPREDGDQWMR